MLCFLNVVLVCCSIFIDFRMLLLVFYGGLLLVCCHLLAVIFFVCVLCLELLVAFVLLGAFAWNVCLELVFGTPIGTCVLKFWLECLFGAFCLVLLFGAVVWISCLASFLKVLCVAFVWNL